MKAIGYFTVAVAALLFSSIWNGYALSTLWGWFIVRTFGLPSLSIPAAIGVYLIASYLTHQIQVEDQKGKTTTEQFIQQLVIGFTKPAVALLIGCIVKVWL